MCRTYTDAAQLRSAVDMLFRGFVSGTVHIITCHGFAYCDRFLCNVFERHLLSNCLCSSLSFFAMAQCKTKSRTAGPAGAAAPDYVNASGEGFGCYTQVHPGME